MSLFLFYSVSSFSCCQKDGELGKDYFLVLALGEGQQLGLETFILWPGPSGDDSPALTALLPGHGPTWLSHP